MSLILGWLMLLAIMVWIFHSPSSEDIQRYQQLMEYSEQTKKEQPKEDPPLTQQSRKDVSKQIFFKQDQQRLQSRLNSESSELCYGHKDLGGELVEHFNSVDCMAQEKLFDPASLKNDSSQVSQIIRHIRAEEAIYSYKTGMLEARGVELARYGIAGHAWPTSFQNLTPLLKGRARKIELSLFQEAVFKAEGFQGTFHEGGF